MTMKNKYISKQSNEILTFFNKQDRNCFDYELAKKALPKSGKIKTRWSIQQNIEIETIKTAICTKKS
jgi:predicted transcriptional regulator of viral defense system